MVSAILPVFNGRLFLRATLESVVGQTLREIEVLVVDDGSDDESPAIVEEFAKRDPRVRLIRQTNAGVGAARNTAIREARGRYIAPVDADDTWLPEKLERQVALMEARGPRLGFVYCWSILIDERDQIVGCGNPYAVEGLLPRALLVRNFVQNASVPLFRAEALVAVGGYLTRAEQGGVQGCEDWDLSLRIAERYDVAGVPEALVRYRQVESSLSQRSDHMDRSFAFFLDRARARNRRFAGHLFRWSRARFHVYLMARSYRQGHYVTTIGRVAAAFASDPAMLLNTDLHKTLARSVVRGLLRRGRPQPRRPPAEGGSAATSRTAGFLKTQFNRIQERRWRAILETDRRQAQRDVIVSRAEA